MQVLKKSHGHSSNAVSGNTLERKRGVMVRTSSCLKHAPCEGLLEHSIGVAPGRFFFVTIRGLFSLLNVVGLATLEF